MSKPVFRINAKKLYLKYENLNKNLTKGDILRGLNPKLKVKEYLIAFHETKNNKVAHVLLLLEKKCNITKPGSFDIKPYGWVEIKGKYEAALEYKVICKALTLLDESYLTNIPSLKTNITKMEIEKFDLEEIGLYHKLKSNKKSKELKKVLDVMWNKPNDTNDYLNSIETVINPSKSLK